LKLVFSHENGKWYFVKEVWVVWKYKHQGFLKVHPTLKETRHPLPNGWKN
jgi:hypothetical protein